MTNKNQGNKPGNNQEKEEDTNLDILLSELGRQAKIQIHRLEPRWCDGNLATIDADTGAPLSSEAIREEFGGRKLRVYILRENGTFQTSRVLKFPDPPKKDGRILKYDDVNPSPDSNGNGNGQHHPLPPNPIDGVKDIFAMMMQTQTAQATAMQTMYESRVQSLERMLGVPQQSKNAPTPQSGVAQVKESLQVLADLQGLQDQILGERDPTTGEPTIAENMTQQFFDMMMEREKAKADLALQRAKQDMQPPPPIAPPVKAEPQQQQQQLQPKQEGRSVHDIPDLELAVLMRERYANMDNDDRKTAMAVFMGQYELEEVEEEEENITEQLETGGLESEEDINLGEETDQDSGGIDLTPEDAELLASEPEPA